MEVPQDEQAIKEFLKSAKERVSICHRRFEKRKGYDIDKELAILGILSTNEAWRYVMLIKINEHEITEYDHSGDGSLVWLFKKIINGKPAYIKIKVDQRGCVCLAFHSWNRKGK